MDPSIYNELAEFMAAVNRGGSCPTCGGTIQHRGDWYRCKGCGVEFRRCSIKAQSWNGEVENLNVVR